MKVIEHHSELPQAIKDAPDGGTITVETAVLQELGRREANRMMRQDLVFEVSLPAMPGTAAANDDEYKATTRRWGNL